MRKKKHAEHENHERWLVSYADFITLLFAFFVVLYATSSQNIEKEKKFEQSIRTELKLVGAGSGGGGAATGANSAMGEVLDPIDLFQKRNVGSGELEDYINRLLDKKMNESEKKQAVSRISHDSSGVRISLAASTYFPLGGVKMKREALKSLDRLAEILRMTDKKVVIEGHTDDLPVVGKQVSSNWELASLRATNVLRYLSEVHHIPAERLSATSYADQRPLVPNTNEVNRAKNRRIEILIMNSEDD